MIWSAWKPPRRVMLWAVLPLLSCGCVSTLGKLDPNAPPAPTVAPSQIMPLWEPEVRLIPDPYHGGVPNAGLVGHIYLFGPDCGVPLTGDGSMVIDLFDVTHDQPVQLEEWKFDRDTLKRLMHRDPRMNGWGYTLFLPWSRYRPDIAKVRLRLGYQTPLASAPLYAAEYNVTLIHPDPSLLASMMTPPLMTPPMVTQPMTSPSMMKGPPPMPVSALPSAAPQLPSPSPTTAGNWPASQPLSAAQSWLAGQQAATSQPVRGIEPASSWAAAQPVSPPPPQPNIIVTAPGTGSWSNGPSPQPAPAVSGTGPTPAMTGWPTNQLPPPPAVAAPTTTSPWSAAPAVAAPTTMTACPPEQPAKFQMTPGVEAAMKELQKTLVAVQAAQTASTPPSALPTDVVPVPGS
jgi:hypothetical protein